MRARPALRSCLAALCVLGCTRADDTGSTHGRLEVRWTGADTASFAAHARAQWCDSLHLLEISAMRNDTGVGVAVFTGSRPASGTFPVRLRAPRDTLTSPDSLTPSSALGLRWFERTTVRGYRGDSGQVVLVRGGDGRISGRFTASAIGVYDTTRLRVTGSFAGLVPHPSPRGCHRPVGSGTTAAADSAPAADSAGVD